MTLAGRGSTQTENSRWQCNIFSGQLFASSTHSDFHKGHTSSVSSSSSAENMLKRKLRKFSTSRNIHRNLRRFINRLGSDSVSVILPAGRSLWNSFASGGACVIGSSTRAEDGCRTELSMTLKECWVIVHWVLWKRSLAICEVCDVAIRSLLFLFTSKIARHPHCSRAGKCIIWAHDRCSSRLGPDRHQWLWREFRHLTCERVNDLHFSGLSEAIKTSPTDKANCDALEA